MKTRSSRGNGPPPMPIGQSTTPAKRTKDDDVDEEGKEDKEAFLFDGVEYGTYQEMVDAKRKRNQERLVASGLLDAMDDMKQKSVPKRPASQGIKKRKVAERPTERRKSKRIAGVESENIFVENERAGKFTISSDTGHATVGEDGDIHQETKEEHYRGRVNGGEDLSIEEAVNLTGPKWVTETSVMNATSFIQSDLVSVVEQGASKPSSPTSVLALDETTKLQSWVDKNTNSLAVEDAEKCVAKVVPDRIYGIAAHPSESKLIVAAGDKSGYVGIWNVDGASEENDGVHLFKFHSGAASCLQWTPSGSSLFSSSYDGTVRVLDVEQGCFTQLFATLDDTFSKDNAGYGLDTGHNFWTQYGCIDNRTMSEKCFFLSTSTGSAIHVDMRAKKPMTFNVQVSEKKVNTISLHQNGYSMITGGLDCTVKLWDVRKLAKKQVKPLAEYFGGKSINSAYFSPTGRYAVVTTMNNKLDILSNFHQSSNLKQREKAWNSIRHDNHTGRWLSTFMAAWHPSHDIFCVGSMSRPRQVEIFEPNSGLVRAVSGDALTAVASRCCFHPSSDKLILYGGNSSGRVTVIR